MKWLFGKSTNEKLMDYITSAEAAHESHRIKQNILVGQFVDLEKEFIDLKKEFQNLQSQLIINPESSKKKKKKNWLRKNERWYKEGVFRI
jgi:hypothetical protein